MGRDLQTLRQDFPWYNPEAYAGAKQLSASEWSLLLEYRRLALESSGDALQAAFEAIVQNPLAIRQLPNPSPAVEETTIVEWRRLASHHALVKDVVDAWFADYGHWDSARYFLGVYFEGLPRLQSLHEIVLEQYAKAHKRIVDTAQELPKDLYEALLSKTVLSIDLRADDQSLVEMFANWLSRKRAAMKEAGYSLGMQAARKKKLFRQFTKKDFERWAKTRVLDYLDICVACRVEKEPEPTNGEFGRLLLAAKADETDVIKSGTKKLAGMLQRPEIIFRLHQQWLLDFLDTKAGL
jgi:hypothetical protein